MTQTNYIIAIDGYSSCGKSTLAKQLARELQFAYVDSGAMYRAIALHFINNSVDLDDENQVVDHLQSATIEFEVVDGENRIFLNGNDVSDEIRKMYVSEIVSKVSPIKAVRQTLVSQQQKMGLSTSLIMDGRDIGTKVFPNATVKLFMTADPKVRANRRYAELIAKKEDVTLDEILENLAKRDHDDTIRLESPLIQAEDAIVIDNSNLSMEEQFYKTLQLIQRIIKKS